MKRVDVRRALLAGVIFIAFAAGLTVELATHRHAQPRTEPAGDPSDVSAFKEPGSSIRSDVVHELSLAAVRLPIAAALGAMLALRRKRINSEMPGGSENVLVIQTQIVLAVVGALVMLVVGASLARAFGIVGVASLIRYRSKIGDPKEAGVMLSALALGTACGVGLYVLAIFGTAFLAAVLTLIESFEPKTRIFELSIKLGEKTTDLRPRIEEVLRRFRVTSELRGSSEDQAQYLITAPHNISTERVTEALTALWPEGVATVEWNEKSKPGSK
jgi:uncharacterized membrane protein YhiD involved in acid resistance